MSDVTTLVEMGFDKQRVEYAMKVTNYKGVEPAMEWLLAHVDEPIPAAATQEQGNSLAAGTSPQPQVGADGGGATVKSLKCDECSKVLRDQTEVEFHAAKTGHLAFSESTEEKKPLTDEEKKEQLAFIEEKLRQKRLEREQREKIEELEREKSRIRSGKDMTEAKKRMEEMEMKKIVEQRKRDKENDKLARERVRAQIEADKAARKARETGQQPASSTTVTSTTSAVSQAANAEPAKAAPKNYAETRIQIRLLDGSTITEKFNAKEPLSAVRVFVQVKSNEQSFGLMTTFPRKVFGDDDYDKPLEVLGLVPSAVLILTKVTS